MEPIRLWRSWDATCALQPFDVKRSREYDDEYAALPRAEYDALVADASETRTLRAERDSLVRERDEAVERADGNFASYRRAVESLSAATARADKAEAALKDALARIDASREAKA